MWTTIAGICSHVDSSGRCFGMVQSWDADCCFSCFRDCPHYWWRRRIHFQEEVKSDDYPVFTSHLDLALDGVGSNVDSAIMIQGIGV